MSEETREAQSVSVRDDLTTGMGDIAGIPEPETEDSEPFDEFTGPWAPLRRGDA